VSADSAENDSPAANAIDGTPSIWLTPWKTANPPGPHALTANLGRAVQVGGFRYLPGQGNTNGQIATFNFYTSPDGVTWNMAWQGTFPNTIAEKLVTIPAAAVAATNHAPVLAAVANQAGLVGTAATLALIATDPDGDALSFAATGLPAGLAINAATGAIAGTPTTAATYPVTAQASDGRGGVSTQAFSWTISPATAGNHAPTLAAVANQTGMVGTASSLALSATDADGDVPSFTATGLPAGLTLNSSTGVISGTPTTIGVSSVTAQASDGRGGVSPQTFSWTVVAAGAAPTTVKYVRLVALSEVNGNPWTSMAEFNLVDSSGATLPRTAWQVSADSAETDGPVANAIDGLPTIWHTQWRTVTPPLPHTFTVNLGGAVQLGAFRYLPRQDGSVNGQIANYAFYTSQDGVTWTLANQGTLPGGTAEKTVTIATIANRAPTLTAVANAAGMVGTAATLALTATDPDGDALTFSATGLPAGMAINAATGVIGGTPTAAGTFPVTAQVSDGRGGVATQGFSWTIAAATAVTTVKYVRLVALTEVNGNPWTSMAEFNLVDSTGATVPRTAWQVSADSAETDGPVAYAIDGLTTIWHTQWRTVTPPLPHTFTVNLGAAVQLGAFRYLPRQDGSVNGQIANYAFYTSQDGVTWTLVNQGTLPGGVAEKTVTLAK
ncbi:MAG TPA: discoidin domain-containing protein, partial [Burkholderiaceae bacterium]